MRREKLEALKELGWTLDDLIELMETLEMLSDILPEKRKTVENCKKELTEEELYEIVRKIILKLGIPAHIKGYKYIIDAIIICINDQEAIGSITKYVYPLVALHFKTAPNRVERAIRHAIEIAWSRGDIEMQNKLFGNTVSNKTGRPTNSEFIAMIVDNVRLQYSFLPKK